MIKFIEKLRNKPEHVKKIILWVVVIIIGLILAVLWIIISSQRIKKFQKEINLPAIQQQIKNIQE